MLIVVIGKIINKIEKMITITIIKKTITVAGDMTTKDTVILYNVVENLAKIEVIVVVIETMMTFIDIGMYMRGTSRK